MLSIKKQGNFRILGGTFWGHKILKEDIGSETAAASSAPEHADQTITRTTVEANGGNSNGR